MVVLFVWRLNFISSKCKFCAWPCKVWCLPKNFRAFSFLPGIKIRWGNKKKKNVGLKSTESLFKTSLSHKHDILQKMSKLCSGGFFLHFLSEWESASMKTTWLDVLSPHQWCSVMVNRVQAEECGGERSSLSSCLAADSSWAQPNTTPQTVREQLFQASEGHLAGIKEQIGPNN